MKFDPRAMTNRELMTEYQTGDSVTKYYMVAEMARRIHRNLITADVVPIFSQYKLNGAGDQYH